MKKLFPLRSICCLLFVFAPLVSARAQLVSPWFRGTPQAWKALTETSFSAARLNAARLSVPLSGQTTGYSVKTTVPNWLTHRLSHSNTFSRMEKDLFKIHPANLPAVTGKLSYFSDRDALLAASSSQGEINQNAFIRHQELLKNTLAEVEDFAKEQIASQFHGAVFPQEELKRFLKDPSQPQAFVLTRSEAELFSTLTLPEQQAFALNAWSSATNRMAALLGQNPQEISTPQYAEYYYLKLRQRYFALLHHVLARANAPRQTIIIRLHKKIPLAFLPEKDMPLTDAQRLGKLYFYSGLMQANGPTSANDWVALQAEIARQNELYRPYALAEAFRLPYEQVLNYHNYPAGLYFGEEEAARINLLTSREALDALPPEIARIQAQMNGLLRAKTLPPDGYVHYFRLAAQEEYLKMRLAQAEFFVHYQP